MEKKGILMPTSVIRFNPQGNPYRSPRTPPSRLPQRPGERRGRPPTPRRGNSPGRWVPPSPLRTPVRPGPIPAPLTRPYVPVTPLIRDGAQRGLRRLPFYKVFRTVNTAANLVTYVIGETSSGQTYVPGYYIEEACAPGVFRNNMGIWSACGLPAIIQVPEASWQPDRPAFLVTWSQDLGEYTPNPSFHILSPGTLYRRMDPDPYPNQRAEVVFSPPVLRLRPWAENNNRPFSVSDIYPNEGPVAAGRPNPQPRVRPQPRLRPGRNTHSSPPPKTKEKKVRAGGAVGKLAAAAFAATEGVDLIDALWDALPEDVQRATPRTGVVTNSGYNPGVRYHSPLDRARAVYRNMNRLNVPQAVRNFIVNHFTDAVIGRASGGADRARVRAGGTAGWGFAT